MTKEPCPHLEAELPGMQSGEDRHQVVRVEDIEGFAEGDFWPTVSQRDVNSFIYNLKKSGLMPHEVTVMVEKFVYNKTLADITTEHGFTSPGITFYIYKKAKEKVERYLTKRGLRSFQREGS